MSPPGCGQNLTDENLIHATECEQVQPTQEPWFTNLVKVRDEGAADEDELEVLRVEADRAKERKEGRREESPKTKKAMRKKEDKDKEAKGEKKEKKAEESSGSEMVEVGQKPLADLFSGTGLDLKAKLRRKVLKKARRLSRSNKKKRSSSASSSSGKKSSSSSSSSKEDEDNLEEISRSSCCDGFDGSQAVPHDGMRAALGCGAEVTSSAGNPILPATPSSRDVATYAARGRHCRSMP